MERLSVCHRFAEAVPIATSLPDTACSKQWHTVVKKCGIGFDRVTWKADRKNA
jgi:hypothetical protein